MRLLPIVLLIQFAWSQAAVITTIHVVTSDPDCFYDDPYRYFCDYSCNPCCGIRSTRRVCYIPNSLFCDCDSALSQFLNDEYPETKIKYLPSAKAAAPVTAATPVITTVTTEATPVVNTTEAPEPAIGTIVVMSTTTAFRK